MLEASLIKWLEEKLSPFSIKVFHNKPAKFKNNKTAKNSRFVTVERIAGGIENYTDRADIIIKTWANTSYEASKLAYKIRNMLVREELPSNIYSIQIDNLYENRDPDGEMGRYAISCYVIATLGDE